MHRVAHCALQSVVLVNQLIQHERMQGMVVVVVGRRRGGAAAGRGCGHGRGGGVGGR